MNPDDLDELLRTGAERFEEMMRRPAECRTLEIELKTAMKLKDVARCRFLLQEKEQWLAQFKSHEFAELMDAAIQADAAADELVGLLLQSGVPAQCVQDQLGPHYQHTPLVTAARIGRLDLIQKLVAAGADLFWASPTGANVLSQIQPSRAGQDLLRDTPEMARVREWLMEQGVRIDPLCADSRRKLVWASSSSVSWPDVPVLLGMGIPLDATGWTPFMLRLASGVAKVDEVKALAPRELHQRDASHRTPFLLAVAAGDREIARALVEAGSDLHAAGHCGATALHLAAEANHCQMVEWLLANGVELDARDEFGHSALRAAVGNNALEAARLLLQKGAELDARDGFGISALREAVGNNGLEAARLLLEKGAKLNERDCFDDGLIHSVDLRGDIAMLELLMNAGAKVNDVSGDGSWPLSSACQQGNAAAVAFLLQAGADPNLTSAGGTALFAAVSADSLECAQLLVQAGADVNVRDCDGCNCLFNLRSEQVAHFLLGQGADAGVTDPCGAFPEDSEWIPISVRQILKNSRISRQGPPS